MTPPPALQVVLFDLDGVLVDSLPPIRASMSLALQEMGRPPLSDAQTRRLIGPPLEQSAELALGERDPARVEEFVARFRAAYQRVYLEASLPARGLHSVLPAFAERFVLVVATSKPEAYARPLLEHLGVASCFRAIVGRSLALDHHTKGQVIEKALTHVPSVAPDHMLMVGDRHHDVTGAREHGIDTVGVLHGMGEEAELREAGAAHVVADLPALRDWVFSAPGSAPRSP